MYKDCTRLMVSWWGRYSYFNNEKIQTSEIEIINSVYSSSVSSR